MKWLILTCLTMSIGFFASAQNPSFAWAIRMGGSASENNRYLSSDSYGNIYATGYFIGTADFDPGAGIYNLTSSGNEDIYVTKCDASGNLIWAKRIGGINPDKGESITIDASGNILLTGTFESTVDFNPGVGVYNLTAGTTTDATFVVKLSANGDFIWAGSIVGSSSCLGKNIKADIAGNIYVCGQYYGTADFDPGIATNNVASVGGSADMFLLKLTAAGNFVWVKTFGNTAADYCQAICIDGNSNIFLTGDFTDVVDFDPGPAIYNMGSTGSNRLFVLKLDVNGNFIWAKGTSGGTCSGLAMALDINNNISITGAFQFTVDFDPGAAVYNLTNTGSYYNVFVLKLDPQGNFLWVLKYGTVYWEKGTSITTDTAGNIYVAGEFRGTIDFDPGTGVYNLSSTLNDFDIFVVKLSAAGNFIWARNTGGIAYGASVLVNSLLDVYTAGNFIGTVDFNPDAGVFNITSLGNTDIYLQKLYQSPCVNPTVPSILPVQNTLCAGQSITLSIDTGSLHSAAAWKWYSGSCGGTLLGIGNSITVTPSINTTYYVRGEGGCVVPGNCASKTITVYPLPIVSVSNATACLGNPIALSGNPAGGLFSVPNPYLGPSTNYTYTYTNAQGCTNSASASITVNANPTILVSVSPDDTLCYGSSVTLTALGANNYVWTNGISTPINGISFTPFSSSTYTVTGTNASGCSATLTVPIVVLQQSPMVSGDTLCGLGTASLTASATGTISWYTALNGGTSLYSGNVYSPSVSATTVYYAENTFLGSVTDTVFSVGASGLSIGSNSISTLSQYLLFNVLQPCVLQSVVVYPGAAGNVILEQRDANGIQILHSSSITVSAAQVGTAVIMPLNWNLTTGNAYRIYRNASSVSLYRNSTGGAYPYSNAWVSITGNSVSPNNYWWAYNWQVSASLNHYCVSPRVPVTALVYPLPIVTTSSANACAGSPTLLNSSPIGGVWSVSNPYNGPSTNYTYSYTDANGCSATASAVITVDTCLISLHLKLFLQGYYLGNQTMAPVLWNQGFSVDTSITDSILLEIHQAQAPYQIQKITSATLNTDGTATCTIPLAYGSYYIVVKHRNSVATWTKDPLILQSNSMTYDFSSTNNTAYGLNMKEVEPGVWAFYSGDFNLDENIDILDMAILEGDVNSFASGYYSTDINGDGNIDLLDVPITDQNIHEFVFSVHP